jgi:hypothetical protein
MWCLRLHCVDESSRQFVLGRHIVDRSALGDLWPGMRCVRVLLVAIAERHEVWRNAPEPNSIGMAARMFGYAELLQPLNHSLVPGGAVAAAEKAWS